MPHSLASADGCLEQTPTNLSRTMGHGNWPIAKAAARRSEASHHDLENLVGLPRGQTLAPPGDPAQTESHLGGPTRRPHTDLLVFRRGGDELETLAWRTADGAGCAVGWSRLDRTSSAHPGHGRSHAAAPGPRTPPIESEPPAEAANPGSPVASMSLVSAQAGGHVQVFQPAVDTTAQARRHFLHKLQQLLGREAV